MKPCDFCHQSPERCICPKPERWPCAECGRRLVRSEIKYIEDERGFIKARVCKDQRLCGAVRGTVTNQ